MVPSVRREARGEQEGGRNEQQAVQVPVAEVDAAGGEEAGSLPASGLEQGRGHAPRSQERRPPVNYERGQPHRLVISQGCSRRKLLLGRGTTTWRRMDFDEII